MTPAGGNGLSLTVAVNCWILPIVLPMSLSRQVLLADRPASRPKTPLMWDSVSFRNSEKARGTFGMRKTLLLAVAMTVVPWGLGGCSSPSRVPVSLEPLNNWLLCHGPATWHYPFSCPPCPYFGSAQASDEAASAGQQANGVSPERSEPVKRTRPADPDAKPN
jgi:hypothetical protein